VLLAFGAEIEKTAGMRGSSDPQLAMLTSLSTEDLIPPDHPIRKIRVVVDAVLAELDPIFDEMYATGGRRSVPRDPGYLSDTTTRYRPKFRVVGEASAFTS
jgi:hypothetical protein